MWVAIALEERLQSRQRLQFEKNCPARSAGPRYWGLLWAPAVHSASAFWSRLLLPSPGVHCDAPCTYYSPSRSWPSCFLLFPPTCLWRPVRPRGRRAVGTAPFVFPTFSFPKALPKNPRGGGGALVKPSQQRPTSTPKYTSAPPHPRPSHPAAPAAPPQKLPPGGSDDTNPTRSKMVTRVRSTRAVDSR